MSYDYSIITEGQDFGTWDGYLAAPGWQLLFVDPTVLSSHDVALITASIRVERVRPDVPIDSGRYPSIWVNENTGDASFIRPGYDNKAPDEFLESIGRHR